MYIFIKAKTNIHVHIFMDRLMNRKARILEIAGSIQIIAMCEASRERRLPRILPTLKLSVIALRICPAPAAVFTADPWYNFIIIRLCTLAHWMMVLENESYRHHVATLCL